MHNCAYIHTVTNSGLCVWLWHLIKCYKTATNNNEPQCMCMMTMWYVYICVLVSVCQLRSSILQIIQIHGYMNTHTYGYTHTIRIPILASTKAPNNIWTIYTLRCDMFKKKKKLKEEAATAAGSSSSSNRTMVYSIFKWQVPKRICYIEIILYSSEWKDSLLSFCLNFNTN